MEGEIRDSQQAVPREPRIIDSPEDGAGHTEEEEIYQFFEQLAGTVVAEWRLWLGDFAGPTRGQVIRFVDEIIFFIER